MRKIDKRRSSIHVYTARGTKTYIRMNAYGTKTQAKQVAKVLKVFNKARVRIVREGTEYAVYAFKP